MTVKWPLRRYRRVGWALSLLILLTACDDTASVDPSDSTPYTETSITSVELPTLWALGSTNYRPIALSLTVPYSVEQAILSGEVESPWVTLNLTPLGGGEEINLLLFDDGNTLDLEEVGAPSVDTSFTAASSSDLIPNDFNYTLRINSKFTDVAGSYLATFMAVIFEPGVSAPDLGADPPDGFVFLGTIQDTVIVSSNAAPTVDLSAAVLPDSLYSGFASTQWSVNAIDPDASSGDEVASVNLEVLSGNTSLRELIFTSSGGSLWTLQVDSSFTAGLTTGDVTFRITATDLFNQVSAPVDSTVWVENGKPVLSDPVMPDTVVVPSGTDPNLYTLTVVVRDPQSQLDIERVYYEVIDPTDNHFTNPDWVLTDSGEDPDAVAQDRIWSAGIRTEAGNTNLGTYHFLFFAEDRGGNISDALDVPIVMVSE